MTIFNKFIPERSFSGVFLLESDTVSKLENERNASDLSVTSFIFAALQYREMGSRIKKQSVAAECNRCVCGITVIDRTVFDSRHGRNRNGYASARNFGEKEKTEFFEEKHTLTSIAVVRFAAPDICLISRVRAPHENERASRASPIS
jgi:hypothetical protein